MRKTIFCLLILILGFIFSGSLNSCTSTKELTYFNNITKDTTVKVQLQSFETVISNNDVLQISFSTPDPVFTTAINAAGAVGSASGVIGGYLVDESGLIKLPQIGTVKAEGLTKSDLAKKITDELLARKLALDPIVTVRIINYKITVLGEVGHPGVIPVPNERITLPEALGYAGDLTIYGKRDNIHLVRIVNGVKIDKRFSLNNDDMFKKDIYNLQNNDIIYVEPNKARAASTGLTTTLLPIAVSVVSLILIIYTQFRN